jgi:hypothetical protein
LALLKLVRAVGFALVLVLVNQSYSALSAAVTDNMPPFTAGGTVSLQLFLKAGATNATKKTEKEVYFSYSNGWWQIELKKEKGSFQSGDKALPKGPSAEQMAGAITDCRNISDGVRYLLTGRKQQEMAAVSNVWLSAFLESTTFPPPEMSDLFLCWLTLCPNPELPVNAGNKMRRLISVDFLKNPQNQGEYTLQHLAPDNVFLSELCITNNGTILMRDGSLMKLLPPFDKGHLEFDYKILETTNWNGVMFPLRSVLHKYVPLPGATNREGLFAALESRLSIGSFQVGVESPEIDLKKSKFVVMVHDNRLPHLPGREPIMYVVTNVNDHWMAATNPVLVQYAALFNHVVKSAPDPATMTARKRHVVEAGMLALALAPLVILIRYRTARTTNNNKTA